MSTSSPIRVALSQNDLFPSPTATDKRKLHFGFILRRPQAQVPLPLSYLVRRRRDRHCQWRHDDIFDISSLKVTARVVFPAKRTRVPTDSEAPNADECDGDQIEERSGNWDRLFNVVFQPLVPAFYRFQTGRVPTIVHSTHGPAPFCRISCALLVSCHSFLSCDRPSVLGRSSFVNCKTTTAH